MRKKIWAGIMAMICLTVSMCSACSGKTDAPRFHINEWGELIAVYADGTIKNLGEVKGADGKDGQDGKDGKDGEKGEKGENGTVDHAVTIGPNGHWYIDGEDTFYIAGERDAIKVTENSVPFDYERSEQIALKNVPKTKTKYDVNNFKIENFVKAQRLTTDNIDYVYSYFDWRCRETNPDWHGLLVLPDTSGITCLKTRYVIYHETDTSEGFEIDCYMDGYVQMPDGREYVINLHADPWNITNSFKSPGDPWGTDVLTRYICNDGEAFITQSRIKAVPGIGAQGRPLNSYNYLVLNYVSQKNNPYETELQEEEKKWYITHDYVFVFLNVIDGRYTLNPPATALTDAEMRLVTDEVYRLLQNRFVVYDYAYYGKQYERE